jgi:histidine triad (HIT) family protein
MKEEQKELVGHLVYVATKIAKEEKLNNGYRIVVNDGRDGGKT